VVAVVVLLFERELFFSEPFDNIIESTKYPKEIRRIFQLAWNFGIILIKKEKKVCKYMFLTVCL